MKNFRDILVWQKAHSLTLDCYRVRNGFPRQELHGITSQARRALHQWREYCRELRDKRQCGIPTISRVRCRLRKRAFLLVRDLAVLASERYERLNSGIVEIQRMVALLIQKVQGERLQAAC